MRESILLTISLIFGLCGLLDANICIKNTDIDYIIVGSGATGAVLANRLTELADIKVLLLEAGGEPLHVSKIPLITFKALNTSMDWNHTTVPQLTGCQSFLRESAPQSRGKCLGGTTSINFMTYTRGNKKDYDLWAELGNKGWSHDDVYPYFLKLENYRVPMSREEAKYHNTGGPVYAEDPPYRSVLSYAFPEMGREMGWPTVDYNGPTQVGFMYPPVSIHNGERWGTYQAYIKPAMKRKNLMVETRALVTRILFNPANDTATGVMYENALGEKCMVYAKKEVIISAGTYNTPQLMMLSGLGPKKHLIEKKITPVKDIPGVGENLQDHVTIGGMMYTLNQPVGMNSVRLETPENEELWERTKTGPMTVPVSFEGVAFIKTNFTLAKEPDFPDWPDLEIFFNTDNSVRIYKPILKQAAKDIIPDDEVEGCTFHPILLRPKSRGTVQLFSNDPHDHPRIDPKYLHHGDDAKVLAEAIAIIQAFGSTRALAQYGAQLANLGVFPGCVLKLLGGMQAYRLCFAKMFSSTGYHPTSTCKMGNDTDPMAVVDHELRVRGIKNLRIADASIMPNVPAAHTQIPCMMIGEKLSDMIKKGLGKLKN